MLIHGQVLNMPRPQPYGFEMDLVCVRIDGERGDPIPKPKKEHTVCFPPPGCTIQALGHSSIEGGTYILKRNLLKCRSCGTLWEETAQQEGSDEEQRLKCPSCEGNQIIDLSRQVGGKQGGGRGGGKGWPGGKGRGWR